MLTGTTSPGADCPMPMKENPEWRATVAAYASLVAALTDGGTLDIERLVLYLTVAELALRDGGEVQAAELVAWMSGRLPPHHGPHARTSPHFSPGRLSASKRSWVSRG